MQTGRTIGYVLMAIALAAAAYILYQPVKTGSGSTVTGVVCANNAVQPSYDPRYTEDCPDAVKNQRYLAGAVFGGGFLIGLIIVVAGKKVRPRMRKNVGGMPY